MESIGKRLARLRKEKGLSQAKLAELAGFSGQGAIGNIERDVRGYGASILAIADALGTTPEYLQTGANPTKKSNIELGPDIRGAVPLINWVQAGAWCEVIDVAEVREPAPNYHDSSTYLPCPVPHSPTTFALRVKGDSMTAPYGRSYPEGCIIFVDPERRSPVNGDRIVACLADSNEVTFKVYKNEDGRRWLQPLNPLHQPLHDRFSVLGTVLGKWEDG